MSADPIDQSGKRLFRAAREELPPEGAQRRALDAARRAMASPSVGRASSPRALGVRFSGLAASMAVAAAAVLFMRQPQSPSELIQAERVQAGKPGNAVADPEPRSERRSMEEPPSAESTRPAPTPSIQPTPVAPPPARSAAPSLAEEIELLRAAETAIAGGDPRGALKALDRYDLVLKGKQMRAEATLLRIEALARAGESESATQLARRFVERNPTSPLVDRARSFIASGRDEK